MQIYKL